MTVRPTVQCVTYTMRGQVHCRHVFSHYVMEGQWRRQCVSAIARVTRISLDTPLVICQKTLADHDEMCILES